MSWRKLVRQATRLNALGTLYTHGAIKEDVYLKLKAQAVAGVRAVFDGPARRFAAVMAGRVESFDLLDGSGEVSLQNLRGMADWLGWGRDEYVEPVLRGVMRWAAIAAIGESSYFEPAGCGGVCLVCVPVVEE
jgi:hypothetical protein